MQVSPTASEFWWNLWGCAVDFILPTLNLLQPKVFFYEFTPIQSKYISMKSASLVVPSSIKKHIQDFLYWDSQFFDGRGVGIFTTEVITEIPRLYLLCVVQDFSNNGDQSEKAQFFLADFPWHHFVWNIFIWLIKIHLFPRLPHAIEKTHIKSLSSDVCYVSG